MNIIGLLASYDSIDKKGFYETEIVGNLTNVDESEKTKPEFQYEALAFRLVPSNDSPWGFYFGPQFTFTDNQGQLIYSPALEEITPESVDYWKDRYQKATNPLLKMRYAGLVWDFEQKICQRGHDADLYRIYVDSILAVCNGDYCAHPIITANVLERLFSITKGQSADLALTKAAYRDFESRHATDEAVRLWASQFLLILDKNSKKFFTQEEKDELVRKHEERLARLSTPNTEGKINPWLVQSQADLLAQYYNSLQDKDNLRRVLKCEEEAFMHEKENLNSMQLLGNLEQVYKTYQHYGLTGEAKLLSAELQNIGEKAKDEMQAHSYEYEIPQEVFDQADMMFGDKVNDDAERWRNFAVYFIPSISDQKKSLQELVKKYPMKFMMATNMMDIKGRPMSIVGSYENDPDGQLILHVTEHLNLGAHFLGIAINRLLITKTLTTEKVMTYLVEPCPLFEETRYNVIKRAIQYFIDGEYPLFCHLIVPQIECAICNLVEMSGKSVLKPQNGKEGFQLRTLDDLLRDDAVKIAFTEDGAFYLRVVLTDQRGLNIRNLLCHGILPPQYFESGAAARLLHVLVMLGSVREQ